MNRDPSKKFGGGVASARSLGTSGGGHYTGAELAMTSARPGAYDATRIPSLIHGQRVTREQQRADLHAPLPATCPVSPRPPTRVTVPEGAQAEKIVCGATLPPPPPAAPPKVQRVGAVAQVVAAKPTRAAPPAEAPQGYAPREGSVPARVLQHLADFGGGPITYHRLRVLFGIAPNAANAVFKRCLDAGLLVKLQIEEDGHMRAAFALPRALTASAAAWAGGRPAPGSAPVSAATLLSQLQAVAAQGRYMLETLEAGIQQLQKFQSAGAPAHVAE